ncbi:MAG: carboxypeptidase regulatory-like domain-containing protein [Acidobacteriota bacterium]
MAVRYLGTLVGVLLAVCLVCWAQTSNQGAIVGKVTDPSGAATPGVEVTARNVATGVERQTITNDVGDFRIDFLIPGIYQVTGILPGFKKSTVDGVPISVGDQRRVDLRLEIGETSQEVLVTAQATALNTEAPDLSEVIDTEKIQNLPLNGREFLSLAELTPGAESGSIRRGVVYSRGFAIGVNGARASYNNYQMDGADITTTNNELASSPALEAIQEFRIQTNMYSAQYGRAGGAVINVVTKSGGNQYHGSLFEYHRNKALDAMPWRYSGERSKLAQYLYNQFGGSVGGPIIRNKTFFFGTVELFRQKRPGSLSVGFSPNAKERAGDVSESINPYSRQPVQLVNPWTKEVIPDGKLPANLISPVGRKIVDELYPEPNYDDPFLNLRKFLGGTFNQDKYLVRVDHSLSAKDSLFGTFDFNDYDTESQGWNKWNDTSSVQHARTASGTYTHTFSPTVVNDLKLTYLHYNSISGPSAADLNYGKEFGISDRLHKANGFPGILLYGPSYMNIGGNSISHVNNETWYLKDNLGWVRGKHTLMFGGDWRRQEHNYKSFAGYARYYFGLTEGHTAQSLKNIYLITGSTFTSLLMAIPNLIDGGQGEDKLIPLKRDALSFYVQDDWKATPWLTLNLGLRYDYESPFEVTNGQFMTLDFNTGLPRYAKGAPADKLAKLRFKYLTDGPSRAYEPDTRDFAPRIGFALRPFNDNRLVVRGGYGIVYGSEAAAYTVMGSYVAPFAGQTGYIYPKYAAVWPDKQEHIRTLDQEPYGIDYVSTATPGVFQATSPDYPTGYVQHWNLTIGRDLFKSTMAEIAYVGSRGVNLNSSQTLMAYDAQLLDKLVAENPAWAGDKGMFAKGYNSAYHSMQLKVRREHSNGLSYVGQYTWSRAMADASEDTSNEHTLLTTVLTNSVPTFYRSRTWTQANFDVRHRLSLNGIWELPFGRGRQLGSTWNPILDGFLGGWRLNWIWSLQGGYPWTVTVSATSWNRPDRICDGNLPKKERTPDRWFDITCFPNVTPVEYTDPETGEKATFTPNGNAGANTIMGPGANNWDWGVHKFFPVKGESRRLEFRAEFFNAFNHPRMQGPSAQFFYNQPDGAKIFRAGNQRQIQLALRFTF